MSSTSSMLPVAREAEAHSKDCAAIDEPGYNSECILPEIADCVVSSSVMETTNDHNVAKMAALSSE